MSYLHNIGTYFLMIAEMFRKPTKWSVMRTLIFKDIDDLIIGSLGIIAFLSFFVGGVVTIQTALNIADFVWTVTVEEPKDFVWTVTAEEPKDFVWKLPETTKKPIEYHDFDLDWDFMC